MRIKKTRIVRFQDFKTFNSFVGLPEPLAANIDAGRYDQRCLMSRSKPVLTDFYRISINTSCATKIGTDLMYPVAFSIPNVPIYWNTANHTGGIYLQVSQDFMHRHCRLFGRHLPRLKRKTLLLTSSESNEIKVVCDSLIRHLQTSSENDSISLSYGHVLLLLLECACHRQLDEEESIVWKFKKILKVVDVYLIRIINELRTKLSLK